MEKLKLKEILKQLHAVEILEYYNKGWLTHSQERNRMKRNHIKHAIELVEKIDE